MQDINRIVMSGRIASVRPGKTAKGTFVANVRLAVNNDQNSAVFWSVAIWGKYGESLFPYLRVGEPCMVDGTLLQDQQGGAFISIGRAGLFRLTASKAESERIAANREAKAAAKPVQKEAAPKKAEAKPTPAKSANTGEFSDLNEEPPVVEGPPVEAYNDDDIPF